MPSLLGVEANNEQGRIYGSNSLIQIIYYYLSRPSKNDILLPEPISCMKITDRPDFASRGLMLDITRDKIPKMEPIFNFVDLLSSWKIYQLQLYTKHTYVYRLHPVDAPGTMRVQQGLKNIIRFWFEMAACVFREDMAGSLIKADTRNRETMKFG
jgi:N-acetyl-beta-hexosaminidase